MSKRRRLRHVFIDAGDGIEIAVRTRGPITPEAAEAFKTLARAAALRMEDCTCRKATDPNLAFGPDPSCPLHGYRVMNRAESERTEA